MVNKTLIKKTFSEYAHSYDKYASIQNRCALHLIRSIAGNGFVRILDVGCGTGNYTRLLKRRFPDAMIRALDISPGMITVARRKLSGSTITFTVADAETAGFNETFDCVSSNAVFQWFDNLEETIHRYGGYITKNGMISFSIFGPLTFCELSASLCTLYGKRMPLHASSFPEKSKIESMLDPAFRDVVVQEKIFKEESVSVRALLRKIRHTGARGEGVRGTGLMTSRVIEKLDRIYKEKFGSITATYQVFFCKAIR